jgi:hypothetical protein
MTTTNALESFFPELRSELAPPESEAILNKRRRIAELEETSRASQLAVQMAEKKLNQSVAATNSKKRSRVEMDAKEPSLSSSTTISSSEEEDEDLEKSESIGDEDEEDEEEEDEDEDESDDDVSTDESQQEREFKENKKLLEKAKKKKLEKLNTKKPKKSVSPSSSQKQPLVSRKGPTPDALLETLMADEKQEEVVVVAPTEPVQDREEKLKEILETVRNTIHHEENLHQLNSALKKTVEDKLTELKSKETNLSERENALEEKLKELKKKETEFNWKESLQNEGRDKEAQIREKALSDREKEIKQKEQHYEKLTQDIAKHEEAVKKFEVMKSEWSKKEKELKNAQEKYAKESKELRDARFAFNEKENSLKLEENKWVVANRAVENDRAALNKQTESLKKRETELNQLQESLASNQQLSTGIIDKIVADTIANNVKEFNESLLSILTESQQKQYVPGFFRDELILNTAQTTDYQVTLIRHKEKKNLVFFQMAGK